MGSGSRPGIARATTRVNLYPESGKLGPMDVENRRSQELTEGIERAAHRALLYAVGLSKQDMLKPFVAVANSWNEIVPGHIHLRELSEAVKAGVRAAGGIPFEFDTIALCDGLCQGHA